MLQVLFPGVQNTEEADVGPKVLRVASDFEQRGSAGAEEQVVQQPLVPKHEGGELMWPREDHMEVRHWQQLGGTRVASHLARALP